MKHGIFISYSDFDKDKVALIVKELEGNTEFFPIVIASNREALKPLAQKVTDGIIKCKIILPILTTRSISTQWINQEIGFATALNKRIMPIVEIELIDNLKGFIHKQIDLPYNYNSNPNKTEENLAFVNKIKELLHDLKIEFQTSPKEISSTDKSIFDQGLEQLDKMNEEERIKREKNTFFNSQDAILSSTNEVTTIFSDIEEKIKMLNEKGLTFSWEKEINRPTFILQSGEFSFKIVWRTHYSNSTDNAFLEVVYYKGFFSHKHAISPRNEPAVAITSKYSFDLDSKKQICWFNLKDKKQYYSKQIVEGCFAWLIDQISKKKTQ